jgi:hypothetical protein
MAHSLIALGLVILVAGLLGRIWGGCPATL